MLAFMSNRGYVIQDFVFYSIVGSSTPRGKHSSSASMTGFSVGARNSDTALSGSSALRQQIHPNATLSPRVTNKRLVKVDCLFCRDRRFTASMSGTGLLICG